MASWARNTPAAAHALETALLSLTAERAGLSLAKWMHPKSPDGVFVNATLAAHSLEETVEQARQAVAAGFSTLKVKVGADTPDEDWARLHAVRESVGMHTALRADANGAWDVERASAMLAKWRDVHLEYIEQPLPADDLSGMARLKADGNVPVAADESVNSVEGARRVLDCQAADLLILKPMVLGGVLPALRIAHTALARGVRVVVTSSLEGVFGRTASLHLAAAVFGAHAEAGLAGAAPACGLATGGLLAADLLDHPPEPRSGRLALPKGVGLGLPAPVRFFD
ncbi:MAG: o-succinylbenzoate synthase [bacterium]